MYSKFGFVDRPLNPSGVPPIERRYSPVGFENELGRIKSAINAFLKGSDNIAVVIVGQYGWGKSELLDAVEAEAHRLGLKTLRLPLTFGLDINTVISTILNARRASADPMLILIDEADEVSRVVELSNAISPGDAAKVRDMVIKLGSLIRALIEPRNYRDVLGVDPRRLGRLMIILAFTPQLYYNVLKNMVPDVFDITRGRIYAEIVLDERMPLWLYEAMLIQRFNSYSTDERLELVRKGLMNPLYPLRREYLATLYEIVVNTEGGKASPRALVKFTSKLLDLLIDRGVALNYEIFEDFLRMEVSTGELKAYLDVMGEGPSDDNGQRVFKALLLSGIPRTLDDLNAELGFDTSPIVSALVKAGLVEEVQIVRVRLDPNALARVNNELVRLGIAPIEGDLRDISISYGSYYTAYEDGPTMYIILPANLKTDFANAARAFQASPRLHRMLVFGREPEEIVRAKEEVSRAIGIINAFREELATEIVRAALNSQSTLHQVSQGIWVSVHESPLDARLGVVVGLDANINQLIKFLGKVVSEGSFIINGQEKILDALLVIITSRSLLTSDINNAITSALGSLSWKVVLGPINDYVYFSVFGSDGIDRLRSIIIGSRLERVDRVPREYVAFLERLNEYRNEVSAFRDRVRQRILRYTMAIRRGAKESKESVIRHIVEAWAQGGDLSDQPEVFRDGSGRARVSDVEESFINYLRLLGKRSFTSKELEYLIRRLYPTHLWREFREGDLIRLLILRGLLLPINPELTEYAPYNPEIIPQSLRALEQHLARLNEAFSRPLVISIDKLGEKIEVRSGVNVQGSDCEKRLSLLKAIPETSTEFLRKYSLFMVCLDKFRDEAERRLEELNDSVKAISAQLNNAINEALNKLNSARGSLGTVLTRVVSDIDRIINDSLAKVRSYLARLNGVEIENLRESLPSILEAINHEVNKVVELVGVVRSVEDRVREYEELSNTLSNASVIMGRRVMVMSVEDFENDIALLLNTNSLESLSRYLNTLERVVEIRRKEVSEVLSSVNLIINKYSKVIAWLRKRGSNKLVSKAVGGEVPEIPTPSPGLDNAKYISDVIRRVDEAINVIGKEVGVPSNVLMAIVSQGPNVGIDEEVLSRELGVTIDVINKYLEAMWRAGLIDRKYVT
ncbi:MAG: hypothetical protein L7H00_01825 [Vulcanisaeta sp.]|nr:hypothetical protein [Vulcanisaeta sp.]MCG2892250.1 hypothetical protein [Vulcanisaeta sp.]